MILTERNSRRATLAHVRPVEVRAVGEVQRRKLAIPAQYRIV
jgi:hypothetical protein